MSSSSRRKEIESRRRPTAKEIDRRSEERQLEIEEQELEECTFRPQLHSWKLVKSKDGSTQLQDYEQELDTIDRLSTPRRPVVKPIDKLPTRPSWNNDFAGLSIAEQQPVTSSNDDAADVGTANTAQQQEETGIAAVPKLWDWKLRQARQNQNQKEREHAAGIPSDHNWQGRRRAVDSNTHVIVAEPAPRIVDEDVERMLAEWRRKNADTLAVRFS